MPSYIGAAIATVKHTCWEFYRLIGDKTKASLRRVLRRVLRLNLTTFTVNGGIYDLRLPASRGIIPTRLYKTGGSSRAFDSQKLPGAPSAPSLKRQPESATNWIQHHVKWHEW
jgi:hypothetical protein